MLETLFLLSLLLYQLCAIIFLSQDFRAAVVRLCSGDGEVRAVLVVSFHRPTLKQTGEGHFSPVAAYDSLTDTCLVLDVARFKYPPFWVPLADLHAAMQVPEPVSGRPRGYAIIAAGDEKCCQESTHSTCSTSCKNPHV